MTRPQIGKIIDQFLDCVVRILQSHGHSKALTSGKLAEDSTAISGSGILINQSKTIPCLDRAGLAKTRTRGNGSIFPKGRIIGSSAPTKSRIQQEASP